MNSTALPPGRTCGHRWVSSLFSASSSVSASGTPPAADTRNNPLDGSGVKTIVPSGLQLAPRLRLTSHNLIGVPPLIGTFFKAVGVTKPSQSPSGEKNG